MEDNVINLKDYRRQDEELEQLGKESYKERSTRQRKLDLEIDREARRRLAAEEASIIELPTKQSLREALDTEETEVDWQIQYFVPKNCNVLLGATYGAGKTTLVYNYSKVLADGIPWLGKYETAQVDSLAVLDLEMPRRDLLRGYRDIGIKNLDRIYPYTLRGRGSLFDIMNEDLRAKWIEELTGVSYLIIDPIFPLFASLGLDVESNSDVSKFTAALDNLIYETGMQGCLITHHTGNANMHRVLGASRWMGWSDEAWMLDKNDNQRTLRAEKPRHSTFGKVQLEFDKSTNALSAQSDDVVLENSNGKEKSAYTAIMALSSNRESGTTITDVLRELEEQEIKVSRNTVDKYINNLIGKDLVEEVPNTTGRGKTRRVRPRNRSNQNSDYGLFGSLSG